MLKPIIKIHNAETDEVIEREMTDEELKQHNADSEKSLTWLKTIEVKKIEKAILLERLGITEEEAQLLLN